MLKSEISLLQKYKLLILKHCIGEAYWKYFVGYLNHFNNETKPVLIKLSKESGSVKILER